MIKRIILMFVGVALMALPALAQTFGTQQAEQPNAAFQSTSTMMGSGSAYSANPTLNENGTATYNGTSAYGPRRAKMDDPTPSSGSPFSGGGNDPAQTDPNEDPIGDAVLPLLFMSLAFGMFVYFRRKRSKA